MRLHQNSPISNNLFGISLDVINVGQFSKNYFRFRGTKNHSNALKEHNGSARFGLIWFTGIFSQIKLSNRPKNYINRTKFCKGLAHSANNLNQDVRVLVSWWKMFVFRKIWSALFSCGNRFEIRPFAILPTTFSQREKLMLTFTCSKWTIEGLENGVN